MADNGRHVRHDTSSTDTPTRHYPLNLPSTPFSRYEHPRLTVRDILVHRIMEGIMNPSKKLSDLALYSHCNVLSLLLFNSPNSVESNWSPFFHRSSLPMIGNSHISTDFVLDMVMLHYLENDDSALRAWIADAGYLPVRSDQTHVGFEVVRGYSVLKEDAISYVQKYRPSLVIQDCCPLFGGGVLGPSIRRGLDQYDIGLHGKYRRPDLHISDPPRTAESMPFWPEVNQWPRHFLWPKASDRLREVDLSLTNPLWWSRGCILDFSTRPGRGLNRDGHWSTGRPPRRRVDDGRYERERKRCTSEPPPGSFASAETPDVYDNSGIDIIFSRMTFSQLDRRSRSRSLSRTRIAEMFDWDVNVPNLRDEPPTTTGSRCGNCLKPHHTTLQCRSPCGHCGVASPVAIEAWGCEHILTDVFKRFLGLHQNPHVAPHCPVAPRNRCKCVQFPTYHTAAKCEVACSRNCGNTAPPGSSRHPNAMLCKSRCCMCGIRGHSGNECTNKTCRCGGHHLSQDCCWNPTCRVPGCDQYLCGIHCRECGSTERPFQERQCWRCHGAEEPFPWAGQKRRNRKTRTSESRKFKGWVMESNGHPRSHLETPARGRSKVNTTVQESIFGGPRTISQG